MVSVIKGTTLLARSARALKGLLARNTLKPHEILSLQDLGLTTEQEKALAVELALKYWPEVATAKAQRSQREHEEAIKRHRRSLGLED